MISEEELERYSRHLILDEIGDEGQERLKEARVAVVGAGGIGAPLLLYLAGAGVGKIRLIDFDNVELSNLQRQPLYETTSLNLPKIAEAARALKARNPLVDLELQDELLDERNASKLLADCDLIVDGSDSYLCRRQVNRSALAKKTPLLMASVMRFEGQLSAFNSAKGAENPCYACLFPEEPAGKRRCADVGVFAPLAGVMGTLAAGEALKILLELEEAIFRKLWLVEALPLRFTSIITRKNKNCSDCAE